MAVALRVSESSHALGRAFDRLDAAIEEVSAEDLGRLGADALDARLIGIESQSRKLEAERLRTITEIEHKQTFRRDGHLSTTSYLAHALGLSHAEASKQTKQAAALAHMPMVRDALNRGELSVSALTELSEVRGIHPEAFSDAERELVELAMTRPVSELRRTIGSWSNRIDARKALAHAEHLHERRWLSITPGVGGMGRVRGELDPETTAVVMTAVGALNDRSVKTRPADDRTHAQRMVDSLGEVCRQFLDGGSRWKAGTERPHVSVLVDLDSLERRAGRTCELERSGTIHPEAARRLACDASISRILTKGPSELLDVGRTTPVVPAGLRRALVVRDRGCSFRGCHAPPSHCDAHHIKHWADGGVTSLENLALLCRRHHRLVHEGNFTIEMNGSGPRFRRPDGTRIEDRGPP
jgi:uncharacterized protein DUF222/HNH endonuclease